MRVVPREHEPVAHDRGVRAQLRLLVAALAVRDVRARAGAVVLPAVERAHDFVAVHGAADADVRTEVRAVRVLEVELAGFVAPQHEVARPVAQRGDVAGCEVLGERDLEPAERDRERETAGHPGDFRTGSIPRAISCAPAGVRVAGFLAVRFAGFLAAWPRRAGSRLRPPRIEAALQRLDQVDDLGVLLRRRARRRCTGPCPCGGRGRARARGRCPRSAPVSTRWSGCR